MFGSSWRRMALSVVIGGSVCAGAIFESEGDIIFALFEQRGDRWLLDEFIFITGSGATPTS